MPEALGVTAVALVWLVATLGAAGTGFGAVAAWASHGHRLRLPTACVRWLDRCLGSPVQPRTVGTKAAAAEAAGPPPPAAVSARPPPPSEAPAEPGPAAPPEEVAEEPSAHPNDAAGEHLSVPPEEAPAPAEPAPSAEPVVDNGSAVSAPPVERSVPASSVDLDAHLADICAGFDVDLTVARALHASGLDDLDHMDGWRSAMRDRAAPAGIDETVWRRACGAASETVHQAAMQAREKRAALAALESLWGVGPEEASALYDAGFRDLDALREASTAKLAAVGSIGRSRAFRIRAAAHGVTPEA